MIDQVGIALTGVTAIFLTQAKREKWRRYACLFGMAGQPFWVWAAFTAEQWGVLFLTALYTAAWSKGIWTHWIVPSKQAQHPLARRAYTMSEPHGAGFRVVLGFEDREAASAAHQHIATIGQEQ